MHPHGVKTPFQRPLAAQAPHWHVAVGLSCTLLFRTPDKQLSLLDVVVEVLELDHPRHVDDVSGLPKSSTLLAACHL
jgi:hypothetical protein